MAEKLKNIPAVIKHLNDNGWKIAKSAAYKHKKEGKLQAGDDGQFLISAINKYAAKWLAKKDGSAGVELNKMQSDRAVAETQKALAQARHWETKTRLELQELVSRDEWDYELAARARVFKSDIENFIRSEASEMIRVFNGDQEKASDLIDYYLKKVELWLDRYSKKKTWGNK